MRPKSKETSIMLLDFIGEKNCYLHYNQANTTNPRILIEAKAFLEYGENRVH